MRRVAQSIGLPALLRRRWPTQLPCSAQQPATMLRSLSGVTMPSPSELSELMDLDLLQDKTPEEIADIWIKYHEEAGGSGRVAAVMSSVEYNTFVARAKPSPTFVLPLKKPGGFMTLLLQCQLPYVLLTSLEEFKRFGPDAPPHVAITHYTELAASKGVVLSRADIINDKVVSQAEARTLMELVRAFYSDASSYAMVHAFNHDQERFDFEQLLGMLGHGDKQQGQQGQQQGTGQQS